MSVMLDWPEFILECRLTARTQWVYTHTDKGRVSHFWPLLYCCLKRDVYTGSDSPETWVIPEDLFLRCFLKAISMFLSSGGNSHVYLCRLQPSAGVCSLETRRWSAFQSTSPYQLKLCGAAQYWSMGPCGVRSHNVFHLRVPKEQEKRRWKRRKRDICPCVIISQKSCQLMWYIYVIGKMRVSKTLNWSTSDNFGFLK